MKAKYAIYYETFGVARSLVDYIVIDISGDPNSNHNRATAICCSDRGGFDYDAEFIGDVDATVEVPVIAMEAMALLLNGDLSVTNWQTLRTALLGAGCVEEQVDGRGYTYQVVYPD